jgi:steroid delta-isomerase-like uncharacterized protein
MEENEQTIPQMVDEVRAGKLPRRRFIKALTAMGISAVGISAIAAAASRQVSSAPAAKIHVNEESREQIRLHDQHLAHQTQSNVSSLHNDYAEHAIVEDSMYPEPFVGRAAIMGRKSVGMAAFPDVTINVTNRVVQGNQLTVEWVASGTHSGHFSGLAATGRTFSIPGVTVVVREHGKIVRESIYYDVAEVHRQLRHN